jgi:hypothetical protein
VREPCGQLRPVLPAALPAGAHHRGGLGEREQQAVEVLTQVQRLDPLIGVVGEPGGEVVQGLAAVQPGHRHDPQIPALEVWALEVWALECGGRQPAGDQDPAGRAGRPQVLQDAHLGQVIQDQRPGPPGPVQPGHEAGRGRLGALVRRAGVDRVRRPGEAGDDRLPVGGAHPDQDLRRPGVPHGVGELHRELCLARAALGGRRHVGLPAVDQHDGLPGAQAAG